MSVGKVLGLSGAVALISGCQSWQIGDIEKLPPTAALPEQSEQGMVQAWYYDGISGTTVDALVTAEAYPESPDEIVELNELQRLDNRANNYGTLIRGYIQPQETGEYTFYVSGDDETEFWLSDSQNTEGLSLLATTTRATPIQDYDRYSAQTSPVQFLEAGNRYYFELRHKEGGWDDHFSVAWQGPGIGRQVVGGNYLYSYAQTVQAPDETTEEAYKRGYRIGYFDGEQGLDFNPQYPPLDQDGDGLYDNWEVVYGLNPNNPADALSDQDDDLLTALVEFELGTSPTQADTDGDGIPDGYEYAYGLDPRDPADADTDLDGDGYTVLEEYMAGTSPLNPDDHPIDEPEYVSGFVGQYFSGTDFDQFLYSELNPTIDYNWGSGSPSPDVPNNRFSIRWSGWFTPPHDNGTRDYQFTTTTDDGVRLYVNGDLVINQWQNQSPTSYSATVSLSAEERVAVTMEYYEFGWDAQASLTIVDQQTGSTLTIPNVIESLDLASEHQVSSLDDGIPDLYKLRYGLPLMQPSSGMVLNEEGITVMEAYQSGLHPYTLETVSEPESPITDEPAAVAPVSTVTLTWAAPGTRVDGSSISLSEIESYEIRYGTSPETLAQTVVVPGQATEYTFDELAPGTWYFNIRVIDTDGLASQPSETIEYQVD